MISIQSAKVLCEALEVNSEFFDENNEEYTMLRDQNHLLWVAFGELFELSTQKAVQEASIEGVHAFEAGLELDNNPYDESSSKHDEWDDGWSTAKKDYNS